MIMEPTEDCTSQYDLLHHHKNASVPASSVDVDHGSPSPSLNAMCVPGFPGVLSLHHYRRYLSDSPPDDSDEIKKLRRKNAAFNLNQYQCQTHMHSCHAHPHPYHQPFSVSSVTSSPPPLSPSYSPSAWSEQSPESLDGFRLPGSSSPFDSSAEQTYSSPTKPNPHKILDTFRDRLEKHPDDSDDAVHIQPKTPPTTIVHHGTSFEILNPRASLRLARIVSYIEDVDRSADAPFYSPDSSLHTQSIDEEDEDADEDCHPTDGPVTAHADLVGDSPHHPMPSISERLDEKDHDPGLMPAPLAPRPVSSPVSSLGSDLGEPGPVCEGHAWSPRPPSYHEARVPGPGPGSTSAYVPPPFHQDAYPYCGYDEYVHARGLAGPSAPDVVQIHRKLSRRAIADRRKGQNGAAAGSGAFRRICALLRRRRSS
ncbi:hypothetical protein BDV59DRAFT_39000 [Aspergillus ambiguus]|uniref:oxidoreductase, short-chain dehydrogenase/reductase family n=1 Tax=Aspergillus ambiguus TaxID=176160 RepID=UPI003CCDFD65